MSIPIHNPRPLGRAVVLATLLGALASGGAMAAADPNATPNTYTASGTSVANVVATANFTVSGVTQPTVNSTGDVSFVVDSRVSVTVAEISGGTHTVVPDQTTFTGASVMSFWVANTGNVTMDIGVLATDAATSTAAPFGGAADSFDADPSNSYEYYLDVNADGVLDGGDTALPDGGGGVFYLDEVPQNATRRVLVVPTDVPAGVTNGNQAVVYLAGQARAGGTGSSMGAVLTATAGGDTAAGPADIVLNDGDGPAASDAAANDGIHSDADQITVNSAVITLAKSAAPISDPINGATNPKRIPGATLRYTLTVSNGAGAATADNTTISDTLQANTTYVANSLRVSTDDAICGNGTDTNPADSQTANNANGAWNDNATAASVTTVTFGGTGLAAADIAASGSVTFCYDVTIN